MPDVRSAARIVAVSLALAVVLAPGAFNGCLMPCQIAASLATTSSAPPCHHALSNGAPHVGLGNQRSCRHDHGSVGVLLDDAASQLPDGAQAAQAALISVTGPVGFAPSGIALRTAARYWPSPADTSGSGLPLRI
jgi:hypothetical protein